MTEADFQHLERELDIVLPPAYRQALCPFPVPALAGDAEEGELWDDAPALVALNRRLRRGADYNPVVPPHLFAVGYLSGDLVAVDLRTPEAHVWRFDHDGGPEGRAGYRAPYPGLAEFVVEWARDMRADLAGDGYDPESSPEQLAAACAAEGRAADRRTAWAVGIFAALFLAFLLARVYVRGH